MAQLRRLSGASPLPVFVLVAVTVAVGFVLVAGFGDTYLVAGPLILLALGIAFVNPVAALTSCGVAIPFAFSLVYLPRGEFSLLELATLVTATGVAMRVIAGGLPAIRDGWTAFVEPIEITGPIAILFPAAIVALVMIPEMTHRAEALREIRLVLIEPSALLATSLIVLRIERARRFLCVGILGSGAAVAIAAVIQVLTGGGIDVGTVSRATAVYSHPNNLGLYLERTLVLSVAMLALWSRNRVLWIMIGIQGVALFLTFSRGSYIAVIVGVVVVLILQKRRQMMLAVLSIGGAVGIVSMIVFRDRLLDLGGAGTEPTRFAIWRSSLAMIRDHPWFGIGPDQFLYQYSPRYIEPSAWSERYTSHAHNIVLDFWLRLGAAGVGCLIMLWIGVARRLTSSRHVYGKDAIGCGAFALLTTGFVHGLVDNGFFLPDLAAFTMLALALMTTSSLSVATEVE